MSTNTDGGDYYKFVWNEDDDSAGTQKAPLSPRERVAQILQETELGPEDVIDYDPKDLEFQDPDFDFKGGLAFHDDPTVGERTGPGMFHSWDMPMVHHDSSRGRADGQSDASPISEVDLPADHQSTSSRMSRHKFNSFQIKRSHVEDSRIKEPVYQMSSGAESHTVPTTTRRQPIHALLPMDDLEMEMEQSSEEEGMLDLPPEWPEITGDLDTAPIITLDQAQLSQKFHERRKKLKIALFICLVILGLGTFATITYLVVHFLSKG